MQRLADLLVEEAVGDRDQCIEARSTCSCFAIIWSLKAPSFGFLSGWTTALPFVVRRSGRQAASRRVARQVPLETGREDLVTLLDVLGKYGHT